MPECYVPDDGGEYTPYYKREQGHHLLSQALHAIAYLLVNDLLHGSELDPIHRHLPANQRPRVSKAHSAFMVSGRAC